MLILIGFSPAWFAVDRSKKPENLLDQTRRIEWHLSHIDSVRLNEPAKKSLSKALHNLKYIKNTITGIQSFDDLSKQAHFDVRTSIIHVSKSTETVLKAIRSDKENSLPKVRLALLSSDIKQFKANTEYSPRWVILLVAISLGLGTMIGWKRIVVTIGEKIGKTHLTYAQGASAELVAASTIGVSTMFGLPVSTTHVLSSGIAGSMVAGNGRQNLRMGTVRSILIAWVITLPVTIILSGGIFYILRIILD
jgi:PiT family inorganic phosphate transporter